VDVEISAVPALNHLADVHPEGLNPVDPNLGLGLASVAVKLLEVKKPEGVGQLGRDKPAVAQSAE